MHPDSYPTNRIFGDRNQHSGLPTRKESTEGPEEVSTSHSKRITIRDFAHLIGLLNFTHLAIRVAPLHMRALQREKNSGLRRGSYEKRVELRTEQQKDLSWWMTSLVRADETAPWIPQTLAGGPRAVEGGQGGNGRRRRPNCISMNSSSRQQDLH